MPWLNGLESASRDDVLALRSDAARRMSELEAALWDGDRLDQSIVELVRTRVGQLLGLPGTPLDTSVKRSAREDAALGFAEQYVLDPSGITDEHAERLNSLFSEPELTALTFCVAVYDAMGRAELVLGVTEPGASR